MWVVTQNIPLLWAANILGSAGYKHFVPPGLAE
jgi:hypothetical protein